MVELVGTVPVLFYGLCAVACPVGMGAMMWLMMRGGRSRQSGDNQAPMSTPDQAAQEELTRLRAELDELREARAEHRSNTVESP